MTKASDNLFPGIILNEAANDGSDFTNPAADYRRLFLGEDGKLHLKDSAGAITDVVAGSGDVATDSIWDAAGDLAVGSGANTAAKLGKGAAGGVLAMGNSAVIWNAGTSFPASKATGDRYWRTDVMGGVECFWDGTRWLTTQIHSLCSSVTASISADSRPNLGAVYGTYDIYVMRLAVAAYVVTPNDGSKYWTAKVQKNVLATWVDVGSGVSTISLAPDDWVLLTEDINTVVTLSTLVALGVLYTKVSTPSGLIATSSIYYRYVIT